MEGVSVVWLIWLLREVSGQRVRSWEGEKFQLDASGETPLPLGDARDGKRGLGLALFGDLLVVYP